MELTDSLKALFIETAKSLQGSARRLLMARTVKELGVGGQRRAERELGWGRMTMRKGTHELERGCTGLDAWRHAAANVWKPISPICCPTAKRLSIAKVKPTPSSVPIGSIPA